MKRFTPAWLAVCLACSFSTSSLAADALATRAFQGMPADFIKGADISTLLDAEKHGATFYDQNNQRKDPIAILKENGSRHRSPQPNDRAQRVSERGSGISPVSHTLLTRRCRLFPPVI